MGFFDNFGGGRYFDMKGNPIDPDSARAPGINDVDPKDLEENFDKATQAHIAPETLKRWADMRDAKDSKEEDEAASEPDKPKSSLINELMKGTGVAAAPTPLLPVAPAQTQSPTSLMDMYKGAQERPEQFQSGLNTLNNINDRFGAAQRAAVAGAQTAQSPMDVVQAAKKGFMSPEQAASWQQIAQKAGVQNKYGLMAAGVLGPLAEMNAIPMPGVGAAKTEAKEASAAWHELAPSLQNLNKEGKLLITSNPAAEFKAAARATEKAPVQAFNQFKDLKMRNEAKKFAVDSVKAELEAQPALKRDPEYLKQRIKELFNFHIIQNK